MNKIYKSFVAKPTTKELKFAYNIALREKKAKEAANLTQYVWNRLRTATRWSKSEANFQYKNNEERKTIVAALNAIPGLSYKFRRFKNSTVKYIVATGWNK